MKPSHQSDGIILYDHDPTQICVEGCIYYPLQEIIAVRDSTEFVLIRHGTDIQSIIEV